MWEKLRNEYTLEDWYIILYRNKPSENSKLYLMWDYLESVAYEELLDENENPSKCNVIIDEIIEYLKEQKKQSIL